METANSEEKLSSPVSRWLDENGQEITAEQAQASVDREEELNAAASKQMDEEYEQRQQVKASAKQKLIAGETLSEEEAETLLA